MCRQNCFNQRLLFQLKLKGNFNIFAAAKFDNGVTISADIVGICALRILGHLSSKNGAKLKRSIIIIVSSTLCLFNSLVKGIS